MTFDILGRMFEFIILRFSTFNLCEKKMTTFLNQKNKKKILVKLKAKSINL
jgi:hypothetical protein